MEGSCASAVVAGLAIMFTQAMGVCILLQAPAAIQLIGTEGESAEFVLGKHPSPRDSI